jgi:hypothetical protein
MRLAAARRMDPLLQELQVLGESESSQRSYFYVDAYRMMPDGSYQPSKQSSPGWRRR